MVVGIFPIHPSWPLFLFDEAAQTHAYPADICDGYRPRFGEWLAGRVHLLDEGDDIPPALAKAGHAKKSKPMPTVIK